MKKLSQVITEAKKGLDIQENTINYISEKDLSKYTERCKKFLNQDALYVIGWLMANNSTYVKDLTAKKDSSGNALADFYNAGVPKDTEMKELYKKIGLLVKAGQLMQVPVFLKKDQFDGILSGKIAPDEVFLDLTSEKGRNDVAKKFAPLVWKIARSFVGKSSFGIDELHAIGMEGLTRAMNTYGKSQIDTQPKKTADVDKDDLDELLDSEMEKARKANTFLSYAGYCIRWMIIEAIKNQSHLVRIPVSRQNKERQETGRNTKSNSVSGDAGVTKDKDGNQKTLFDTIGGAEEGGKNLDAEDIDKLWGTVKKMLQDKFSEKTLNIFYDFRGLFGHEKLSGKEIMKKYGLKNPSEISNNNFKVTSYMYNDPKLKKLVTELYTLYKECRNEEPDDDYSPIYLNEKMNDFVNSRLEEQNRFFSENFDE